MLKAFLSFFWRGGDILLLTKKFLLFSCTSPIGLIMWTELFLSSFPFLQAEFDPGWENIYILKKCDLRELDQLSICL